MKHIYSFLFLSIFIAITTFGQSVPSATEQQLTKVICDCISELDMTKVKDKAAATNVFSECFMKQPNLIVQLAEERGIDMTDQVAMRALGVDIGKNLMGMGCKNYIALATIMAGNSPGENTGTTEGRLKRIDTKDFNYFVITDVDNNEKSFIWLRQFPGSEKFMNLAGKTKNEKVRIGWREIEVFIPSAKNYYKIKEVISLELL